ncbi:MAG: DUF1761 domain-containing protein [Chitinophagaceae bacterium]|nr:DUF1761 domain-containing protein [Chitinophagaceae bacterium]
MNEQMNQLMAQLMNWPAFLVATLIPTIIGFLWYNPSTPTGKIWVAETNISEEKMKSMNMVLTLGISLVLCFLMNMFIVSHEVIHQWGAFSLLNEHPEEATRILTTYNNEFRTFGHGALHGTFLGLFLVLPIFATNGMFERKSWKLIWVNVIYWTICLAIMGGILCAWK